MNNLKKQAAVTKYLPLSIGKSEEEVKALLAADDKAYPPAEIDEIYQALIAPEKPAAAEQAKYKVNFPVHIAEFEGTFTAEEILNTPEVLEHLINIKSAAISVVKEV
ncbi:hypothetical protein [Mucilaginibacter sp. CSA2-8R]|uniref:hypothetical protein n=1 Tax=Mucilaginibacter sp. CSA2-8R TaxID=3141542 RepID=UPI00315C5826